MVAADLLCLPWLLLIALAIRYDFSFFLVMPWVAIGSAVLVVGSLLLAGVYRTVIRSFDEQFLQQLLVGVGAPIVLLSALAALREIAIPRSVPFIFGCLVFLWVWASRSIIRRGVRVLARLDGPAVRVGIYGAGTAGRQVLAALRAAPEYNPVAFFDDERQLAGTMVQGIPVIAGHRLVEMSGPLHLDEVLIALPSISRGQRRLIIERIEPAHVRVRTLGSLNQFVGGEVSIADLQDVDIGDLLGRDPVPPSSELIGRDIRHKRVLVTGAGGSIGSELCRQILDEKPELLVLLELNEYALYTIDKELRGRSQAAPILAQLGSVLDEDRMARVLSDYRIDTVYHAAAYKHVPLVEANPFEGIANNTLGTLRVARAATHAGVSNFVLVSTDKAVRPTNVMGASKRLAELVLQALAAEPGTRTRFCMVRFGNVLGSSGSVIPLFKEQIARGGPITVTHPDVTRYFMTIPEAAQLVIQAGAMGSGGDVFVLDMGDPVRIVDLARKMIRLCGFTVKEAGGQANGGIEIVFSGLRPGEKLYEELLIGDKSSVTDHPRIKRALEQMIPLTQLMESLALIREIADAQDVPRLKQVLTKLIDGYVPDMTEPEGIGYSSRPPAARPAESESTPVTVGLRTA